MEDYYLVEMEKIMSRIPEKHLHTIIPILMTFHNETQDFNRIHVRSTLEPYLGYILFGYLLLFLGGFGGNIMMAVSLVKGQKTRNKSLKVVYNLLLGNCINDILVKCVLVMPFSMVIMLTIHWTFGNFWCHSFPLIQDICVYSTSITFVVIFYNRYKLVCHIGPELTGVDLLDQSYYQIPAFWGLLGSWGISAVGVIPHTFYIEFIDMSEYFGRQFVGSGFCVVNLEGNIKEYIRGLFIAFYVIPIALVLCFHSRVSSYLKSWPGSDCTEALSLPTITCGVRGAGGGRGSGQQSLVEEQEVISSSSRSSRSVARELPVYGGPAGEGRGGGGIGRGMGDKSESTLFRDLLHEHETQKLLILLFSVHAICLLPINILRISRHVVIETHENSLTFDVLFVAFVAIQFSSLTLIPLIFHVLKARNASASAVVHLNASSQWRELFSPPTDYRLRQSPSSIAEEDEAKPRITLNDALSQ